MLVVDDEPAFQEMVARYLTSYRRINAYNGYQAMQALAKHHVDVVLLDLNLPDTTGLKLLREIRAERDDVEIIIITSHTEIANAVSCVKAGAFDFLAKSYENYQQIGEHVQRALENRKRRRSDILARADDHLREAFTLLEQTASTELAEIVRVLRQVAGTPLTVLIEGESGVGKELLARYVHLHSERAAAPFVPVNVAAIPSSLMEATLFGHEKGAFTSADRQRLGKFELADGGTMFLDEIGELELSAQAKLLRALQEREIERIGAAEPTPIDVRVVAATNKDLEAAVVAGRFREDLWYRLNVVRLRVPPLRARPDDVPALIELLARRHALAMGRLAPSFTQETMAALSSYRWPGNVRELENLIMRLVALHPGATIRGLDIPVEYCTEHLGKLAASSAEREKTTNKRSLYELACDHFERFFVRHMIERCGGNKAEAARRLGVSYSTIKNKLDTQRTEVEPLSLEQDRQE
ncbi:MAG TPA: sigma-54 dependent transcriptional regulator [Haliangiales bacterium]|nr:sigma-54 dependent transcriptional regulator [Haliangiales bacterium]